MAQLENLCERETGILRTELAHLKTCQLTYLTLSITTTGVILGLIRALSPTDPSMSTIGSGIVFLAPLLILLPFWWAFFDKAATIARIVGYQRVLEACLTGRVQSIMFVGWESALRLQRNHDDRYLIRRIPRRGALRMFTLRSHHRYWMVVFYTFFMLTGTCIVSALNFIVRASLPYFDMVMIWGTFVASFTGWVFTVFANLSRILGLLGGELSYDAQEERWIDVLKVSTLPGRPFGPAHA